MSSYLERQASSFRASLAAVADRIQVPPSSAAAAAASSLAPTSPSPSIGSTTSRPETSSNTTPSKKRKREFSEMLAVSQMEQSGYGNEVGTQITFAIEYLKKKGEPKTSTEILEHLSLDRKPEEHRQALVRAMRRNPRIDYTPQPGDNGSDWTTGKYAHRPTIPNVRNEDQLMALMQRKVDFSSVSLRDLKDGWPTADETVKRLEQAKKLRICRGRNDDRIWPDDPTLCNTVDAEFRNMWLRVSVPPTDEIVRKLLAVGLKPASEDPREKDTANVKPKEQKKRAARKSGKTTNTHMEHLLKDYSHLKKR